jgi:hypothetical protein
MIGALLSKAEQWEALIVRKILMFIPDFVSELLSSLFGWDGYDTDARGQRPTDTALRQRFRELSSDSSFAKKLAEAPDP